MVENSFTESNRRRESIEKVVTNNEVKTYEGIKQILAEEHQIETSVSTIKRDVDKLNIVKKKNGQYMLSEEKIKQEKISKLNDSMEKNSLEINEDIELFNIKTKPGYAEVVARNLKEAFPSKIVGTIEKSDTILVITNSGEKTEILKEIK